MKNIFKKMCLIGGLASLTSCNSLMKMVENDADMRYEKAIVPVEFLLDEGVGKVNVSVSYSLTNKTHRDFISDYGYNYSKDLFGFVVPNMVADAFDYQDLYAIGEYKNIYEQNFKRDLKKHYTLFDMTICDVALINLHKSPKEPEQLCSHSPLRYLDVIHTK